MNKLYEVNELLYYLESQIISFEIMWERVSSSSNPFITRYSRSIEAMHEMVSISLNNVTVELSTPLIQQESIISKKENINLEELCIKLKTELTALQRLLEHLTELTDNDEVGLLSNLIGYTLENLEKLSTEISNVHLKR